MQSETLWELCSRCDCRQERQTEQIRRNDCQECPRRQVTGGRNTVELLEWCAGHNVNQF